MQAVLNGGRRRCDFIDLHRAAAVSSPGELEHWMAIVRGEYLEMPGLRLTRAQVQRLWGLDRATCDAVLESLERSKFLRRSIGDSFMRADLEV